MGLRRKEGATELQSFCAMETYLEEETFIAWKKQCREAVYGKYYQHCSLHWLKSL